MAALLFAGACVPSPVTFSPDGTRLAFATPGELETNLWVVDASDGAILHRFTTDWILLSPRYSPTQERIAVIALPELSDETEEMEIWLYNVEREEFGRIVSAPIDGTAYFTLAPEFSPDGTQIAFMELDNGNYDIKRYDLTGRRRIRSLAATPAQEIMPVWSPDGKRLAYFWADQKNPTSWYLHIMEVDRSADTCVFAQPVMIFPEDMASLPTLFEFAPAWSPDGTQLAYCRVNHYTPASGDTTPVVTSRINVYDLTTGKDIEVARRSEPCGSIAWGSRTDTENPYIGLAFASGNSDFIDLYAVESPGVERRITSAAQSIGPKSFYPVWSPNGNVLVYRCGPTVNGTLRWWNVESQSGGWYPACAEDALFLANHFYQERDHTASLYYADLSTLWLRYERAQESLLDGLKGEAVRYYQELMAVAPPRSFFARYARAMLEVLAPETLGAAGGG